MINDGTVVTDDDVDSHSSERIISIMCRYAI